MSTRKVSNPFKVGSEVVEQNIPKIMIELAFVPNPQGGTMIDLSKTAITYEVQSFDDSGRSIHGKQRTVMQPAWNSPVKEAVRSLISFAMSDAERQSLIAPGTDRSDL